MESPFDLQTQLSCFRGAAPLFPLPATVFFPHILLPLHIFEPRYREMTADVLKGNGLMAIAMLKPPERDPSSHVPPPIHSTVCLGRVAAEEKLPDGRYYLVLQGLSRARVLAEECGKGLPYRVGKLELLNDHYPDKPLIDRDAHWRKILAAFRELFPDVHLDRIFQQSKSREVPLGVLCDVLAYAMKLPQVELQRLLEETNVDRRSARVVSRLLKSTSASKPSGSTRARPGFPPQFSVN